MVFAVCAVITSHMVVTAHKVTTKPAVIATQMVIAGILKSLPMHYSLCMWLSLGPLSPLHI